MKRGGAVVLGLALLGVALLPCYDALAWRLFAGR